MPPATEYSPNFLITQPAPALSDIAEIGALATLPDQSLNQLPIIDQAVIVKEHAEFQGTAGQMTTIKVRLTRRRPPTGGTPRLSFFLCLPTAAKTAGRLGLGLRRSWRGMSATHQAQTTLPLFEEVPKQFISRRDFLKEPGLTPPLCRIPNKDIGMGFFNPLTISGLNSARLQIGQKIQRKVDLRPKQGTASFKDLGFRKDWRQLLKSPGISGPPATVGRQAILQQINTLLFYLLPPAMSIRCSLTRV